MNESLKNSLEILESQKNMPEGEKELRRQILIQLDKTSKSIGALGQATDIKLDQLAAEEANKGRCDRFLDWLFRI